MATMPGQYEPYPKHHFTRYENLLDIFNGVTCHRCAELAREQAALRLRWRF